jgi:hypothetical protein
VVIGRLYNDEDRPPVNQAEEVIYIPPYAQNPNVRRVYLEFPGGMTIRIADNELDVNAGKTKVVVQRDGDIIIESKANINVNAEGDASLKSKGNLTISASSIKMESDKDFNIKSGTDMTSEATGQMKIRGATVNIN